MSGSGATTFDVVFVFHPGEQLVDLGVELFGRLRGEEPAVDRDDRVLGHDVFFGAGLDLGDGSVSLPDEVVLAFADPVVVGFKRHQHWVEMALSPWFGRLAWEGSPETTISYHANPFSLVAVCIPVGSSTTP